MVETDWYITDNMIESVRFARVNGHAKINAITSLEFDLFKQKYGRDPEVVEIWDFDDDIKSMARFFCDMIYHYTAVQDIRGEQEVIA